ncbi:hypothetical protein [Niveibacterium microcysteis]|uniref:Uncharacterized protein n=1 Tax=Niveibacterium microcysteis TaxID=2811415 RepID=A0ABX7MAT8_9RHOO|nr:hypothetical protein [Niveibacterium microcysteis]QSI78860.1 hypothetical protein JY500_09720 [Niveibacterium microcysteis]
MQRRRPILTLITAIALGALSGCEQLGLEDGKAVEAEGKAIGAACRHAGRALEDCYQINPKAPKAAIFNGWKEMNDYMTEQKLEIIKPSLPPPLPKSRKKTEAESDTETESETPSKPASTEASAPEGSTEADAKKPAEGEASKAATKTPARKSAAH